MIVLDANILIRAVLGKRVGRLLEEYSMRGVRFFAPDLAYADAADYLPLLLGKKGAADVDASAALRHLQALSNEWIAILMIRSNNRLKSGCGTGMRRTGPC
jgi:hypothetical protein